MAVSGKSRGTRGKSAPPVNPVEAARADAERRAWASLERAVPDDDQRALLTDAVQRYADAIALGVELRAEWEAHGRPLTELGSMRQPIPHPLVKMIGDADLLADRFGAKVGLAAPPPAKRVGRPRGATSAPDRVAPPRLTQAGGGPSLRAVPGGRAE